MNISATLNLKWICQKDFESVLSGDIMVEEKYYQCFSCCADFAPLCPKKNNFLDSQNICTILKFSKSCHHFVFHCKLHEVTSKGGKLLCFLVSSGEMHDSKGCSVKKLKKYEGGIRERRISEKSSHSSQFRPKTVKNR